jgi:3-oxoacyl-[acyl-carrier protein] reductase
VTIPSIPTYPDLAGKAALVTGGSQGIGAETCRMLVAQGTRVALASRNKDNVEARVEELRAAGGEAVGIVADGSVPEDVERMRDEVESSIGPIDVLAAFVGGAGDPVPFEQIGLDAWRSTIDLNLTATYLALHTFLPGMMERGHGSVITMASTAGRLAGHAAASYAAAKAGVLMLTRHLAREVGEHGVRINCISPSAVMTESQEGRIPEEKRAQVISLFPLGRLGTPADCALATLFLASESSSWLTGLTIDVAGGRLIL